MPVTPSYPGIYIQEVPSNTHTIVAAPTSIAVFVGYSHPFKTPNFNKAIQIFSFTDYEQYFGGFFANFAFDNSNQTFASLAHAVYQFFLNGGAEAYVIGLKASYIYSDPSKGPTNEGYVSDNQASLNITTSTPNPPLNTTPANGYGIIFTALEPTDIEHPMTVLIQNAKPNPNSNFRTLRQPGTPPPSPIPLTDYNNDTADITIFYGSRTEIYRGVTINSIDKQNYIENRIGTSGQQLSSLVTVKPLSGVTGVGAYGGEFVNTITDSNHPFGPPLTIPLIQNFIQAQHLSPTSDPPLTVFQVSDFTPIFQQDQDLDKVPIFNLLVLPGIVDPGILSEALAFCEGKQAFLILDPPSGYMPEEGSENPISSYLNIVPRSPNNALYFPYIKSTDPTTGDSIEVPPSGTVAGIYALTDLNRGVWKAPAGLETTILNTTGVVDGTGTQPGHQPDGRMTDLRQGVLNLQGINCLRTFPGVGTVVYGARTLVGYDQPQETPFQQWKYVPVRRMALFIEQTLLRNLGWVVFEPNDEPLWAAIRLSIGNFMLSLFKQGGLQGSTPSQAFQVKCDSSTTTSDDQNRGIVNIIVAFAPLKPAEFVIVNIAQLAGQVQS